VAHPSGTRQSGSSIWKRGLRILRLAIDAHIIISRYLLPLLISQPGGLVVEVTDGTTRYNATHYRISVYYDLAKVAVNRLAFWKIRRRVSLLANSGVGRVPK
jgi:hypothetical protein